MQPGSYEIVVEKQGFQRFARSFTLEVTEQARIDTQLTVGQVSESVEVVAAAVVLETDTSNLGQVITNRQVNDLPLNGRNPFALAALTPGITPLASFGAVWRRRAERPNRQASTISWRTASWRTAG